MAFLKGYTQEPLEEFNRFYQQWENAKEVERKPVVENFIQACKGNGAPFIGGDTAVFIYLGTAENICVAGDFTAWKEDSICLENIPGSDIWFHKLSFPADARLDYKFVKDGKEWLNDPLNPRTLPGGYGNNSELVMPGYVFPYEIVEDTTIQGGRLETFPLIAKEADKEYSITVYLPASYPTVPGMVYPVAYFHDGPEYLEYGRAVKVLDNLIEKGRIRDIIGVFVKPVDRIKEYGLEEKEEYMDFFVHDLISAIDGKYRTARNAESRATIGCSLGGNISAWLCIDHPALIGNCGLHSPAVWLNENEGLKKILSLDHTSVKWFAIWGSYEPTIHIQALQIADHLQKIGAEYRTQVLPEGHSWGLWRARTDDFLQYFFPPVKE